MTPTSMPSTTPLLSKSTPIHLILLDKMPILQQLQLEEALLRADTHNYCLINRGSPPAIVMGISNKPEHLINHDHLTQKPIPVIRRFSGGGTVVIDPQTFFLTWICNAADTHTQCCPTGVHQWAENFVKATFPTINLSLKENDFVIGEKKFGGNAQYLCKGRWLHHSSLLWDYNLEHMHYLQIPAKAPKYRQSRSHEDFLCRLRDFIPSQENLLSQFLQTLNDLFWIKELNPSTLDEILARPHRKGTCSLP